MDTWRYFSQVYSCFHTNSIKCALNKFGPLVRYVCVGVNATTAVRCKPNQSAETSLNSWSRFASRRTLVRFAWDVKANASRSDPVLKSIRLFGRNRHPLSRTHYGNYWLISGNSKTSSMLSDRRVKMSRGSTWSQEEMECLLDIWTDIHIESMLENTHKNHDAFNTFSTRMREKEFDRSATVWNKWISQRVQPAGYQWLFTFADAFPPLFGPYFNGLKRKWEAPSASSFVGGSMAVFLFYRRKNDSCARRKFKKSWSEVA